MILEFSITNTLSIAEKQTLSFEAVVNDDSDSMHCKDIDNKKILKIMCIYGANASGKTKMLEALHFYIGFMLHSFTQWAPNEPTRFIPFKFDKTISQQPGEFEFIFYVKDQKLNKYVRYEYLLKLTSESVEYESLYYAPKGQKKLVFERDGKINKWTNDMTKNTTMIMEELARPNCSMISVGAQIRQPIIKNFYNDLMKKYHGLLFSARDDLSYPVFDRVANDDEFKNKVTALLAAVDIGNITDMKADPVPMPHEFVKKLPNIFQKEFIKNKPYRLENPELIHHYDDDYPLSLFMESAGTLKMLGMTLPLHDLSTNTSIALIDELESSLHQELLEIFLQILIESEEFSQLIFTTHNQDLLDSGILRDDEIWFCYKTERGYSKYNSITDYIGIRKEVSRKKLYQADKFGALPNIDVNTLRELFCAKKNRKNSE